MSCWCDRKLWVWYCWVCVPCLLPLVAVGCGDGCSGRALRGWFKVSGCSGGVALDVISGGAGVKCVVRSFFRYFILDNRNSTA